MTTSYQVLENSIDLAIAANSLQPFIKGLELLLEKDKNSIEHDSITIFSCDSFCFPHRQLQLSLYRHLKRYDKRKVTYVQVPATTYILSIPGLIDRSLLQNISQINSLSHELAVNAAKFSSCYSESFDFLDNNKPLGKKFQTLINVTPINEWNELHINAFPFYEFAYRDLSNTLKLDLPDLTSNDKYSSVVCLAVVLNILTLISFLLLDIKSKTNMGMSFYSANCVFKFYCDQLGLDFLYFDNAMLSEYFVGESGSSLIRIFKTPVDNAYTNKAPLPSNVFNIKEGSLLNMCTKRILKKKLKGIGTQTYSRSKPKRNLSDHYVTRQIQSYRRNGFRVVSLFSSSQDEVSGQVLAYKQYQIDQSHLSNPTFDNQIDWISQTIQHFIRVYPDDLLIIRLHPRLGADHRGLKESPSLDAILSALNKTIGAAKNVLIVEPTCDISSYQIGLNSDLILNGWSTIGLDFAILNKRVIYAFVQCPQGGGAFHPIFHNMEPYKDSSHYFEIVDKALDPVSNDPANYLLDKCLASKGYLITHLAGTVNLREPGSVHAQITNPVILTSYVARLISSNNLLSMMRIILFDSRVMRLYYNIYNRLLARLGC